MRRTAAVRTLWRCASAWTYSCSGQADSGRGSRGLVGFEKMLFMHAGDVCNQNIRESLDRDVEVAHRAVVVAPRHLQLVLDVGELGLQFQEILVGLELRVGFGDRQEPAERTLQRALTARSLCDALGRDRRGATRGDLIKHATLVAGIRLNGLDQVRNQIAATTE